MITSPVFGTKNPLVSICLMGEFSCIVGQPVGFAARSAAELVAYLAINKNRWVPRDEIAEALWPYTEPKIARTNLRKAAQRVRESFGSVNVLVKSGNNLAIDQQLVQTDLEQAEALHRQYSFAPHLPESIESLKAEWKILDQPLLDNWDNDWVIEERKNFELRAHELGLRLIESLEGNGKYDECLEIMNTLVQRSPLDYDLINRVVRLQAKSSNGHLATKLLEQMLTDLPPQSEIPKPVRRLIQRIQQGQVEQIPAPTLFETKNELALLARMVESNLKSNNPEAMALLAKESSNVDNWSHAKTLLSILTVALENSPTETDDQIQVAINACFLATYASDFQTGEWAARRVLDVLPENDERYIRTMSVLAFLHFETKNYEESRRLHDEALALCTKHGADQELPRVLNRKAVLDYHLGNFDVAGAMFMEAIQLETLLNEPGSIARLASFHGNLCTMEVLRSNWEAAKVHGRLTCKFSENSAKIYEIYVSAGLGLAHFKLGEPNAINLVIDGIVQTTRERLRRFNMMAIDFGLAILVDRGAVQQAGQIAALNRIVREASGYPRGPAERNFVKTCFALHSDLSVPNIQPMSLVALSRWLVEELESVQ